MEYKLELVLIPGFRRRPGEEVLCGAGRLRPARGYPDRPTGAAGDAGDPPGSACSIGFGTGVTASEPGS